MKPTVCCLPFVLSSILSVFLRGADFTMLTGVYYTKTTENNKAQMKEMPMCLSKKLTLNDDEIIFCDMLHSLSLCNVTR